MLGFLVICLLSVFVGIKGWVTRQDNLFINIRSPPYIPKNPHLGMSDMSQKNLITLIKASNSPISHQYVGAMHH